jgi:hypothetical protein
MSTQAFPERTVYAYQIEQEGGKVFTSRIYDTVGAAIYASQAHEARKGEKRLGILRLKITLDAVLGG